MTTIPRTIETHAGPVIPVGTETLLGKVPLPRRHPGLQLDKYSSGGTQKDHQGQAVKDVCAAKGDPAALDWATARRAPVLARATTFEARTEGPLTLHLSRASALENAGICLHPLYGFAYLPGSGLKGMARAWAETDGTVPKAEWRKVFGWAPEGRGDKGGEVGAVVFHDAWPTAWPTLVPDIVNNHHPKYYQGDEPPGDWMDPVPVQFLAVAPGTTFLFAVGPRTPDTDPALVAKAVDWLKHALALRGAGAKTNAGYGTLIPVDGAPPKAPNPDLTFETTLELTSPAFLAGATQDGSDCDLRPASLRGLLRWWWRTLHAGSVDAPTLRALETAIWGSTKRGGAVRITLKPGSKSVQQYDFKNYYNKDGELKGGFQPTEKARRKHDLRPAPNNKTTQGLFYISFGMDDITKINDRKIRKQRYFATAGSFWTLTVQVRRSVYVPPVSAAGDRPETALSETDVRLQVQAALWLLIHYGGVGSKGRKGFGSFADQKIDGISSIADCRKVARALRETCSIGKLVPCEGPAIPDEPDILADIVTPWKDPCFVLDCLGFAYQSFAQTHAHDRQKVALGLPRKIHGPKDNGPMKNQSNWQPPEWLGKGHRFKGGRSAEKMRDASPLHFHIAKSESGHLIVRGLSLPSTELDALGGGPDLRRQCLAHVRERLEADIADFGGSGPSGRPRRGGGGGGGGGGQDFSRKGEVDGYSVTVLRDDGDTFRVEFPWGDVEDVAKDDVILI